MKPVSPDRRRIESRIGLTREVRPCGRLSKSRKPCERLTEPYDPWCGQHCSEEERDLGALLRRIYWEGYRHGKMDQARSAR